MGTSLLLALTLAGIPVKILFSSTIFFVFTLTLACFFIQSLIVSTVSLVYFTQTFTLIMVEIPIPSTVFFIALTFTVIFGEVGVVWASQFFLTFTSTGMGVPFLVCIAPFFSAFLGLYTIVQ